MFYFPLYTQREKVMAEIRKFIYAMILFLYLFLVTMKVYGDGKPFLSISNFLLCHAQFFIMF